MFPHFLVQHPLETKEMPVHVCLCERESVCDFACVFTTERERVCVCVCVLYV